MGNRFKSIKISFKEKIVIMPEDVLNIEFDITDGRMDNFIYKLNNKYFKGEYEQVEFD